MPSEREPGPLGLDEPSAFSGLELVGLSHHSAPLEALERLALSPEEVAVFYQRAQGLDAGVLVLSTCNRTEIYAHGSAPLAERLSALLGEVTGPHRAPDVRHLYAKRGRDALEHLFRVAAGLDSMILGEAQILGQVKAAFEEACARLAPAPAFERAVRAALAAGRRSRGETEIGKGAVSVASAAVHLCTRIYSDLSRHTALVVGAGETGQLLAEHLKAQGAGRLRITNRTFARALELARAVDGEAVRYEDLAAAIAEADVVACAVRAPAPIIDRPTLERATQSRGQPLVVLDLGLPRNVEASAQDLRNVFLNDLATLRQVVDANLARRKKEVPRVLAIIEEELLSLAAAQRTLAAGPLIAALRDTVEALRASEVERASRGLSAAERQAVERATRAVCNKLLHGPTTSIRELAVAQAADPQARAHLEAIQRLVEELARARPHSSGTPAPGMSQLEPDTAEAASSSSSASGSAGAAATTSRSR